MRRLLGLALILCGFSTVCMAQAHATFYGYHDGKRYGFEVTPEKLEKSPSWGDDEENPPLPVRRAIEAASAYLKKLMPDAEKWRRSGIKLMPLGEKWVYVVEFTEPPPEGTMEHLSSPFGIVVLMSGEAVEAKIEPWKFSRQRYAPRAPSARLSYALRKGAWQFGPSAINLPVRCRLV